MVRPGRSRVAVDGGEDVHAAPGKFALTPEDAPGLFRDDAAFLLRKD
jgi:hypothetical protein